MQQQSRTAFVSLQLATLTLFLCLTSQWACRAQNLAKPMADMDPDKIIGWWYAWSRTGGLFDSMACARAYFEGLGNEEYRITFTWINSAGQFEHQVMDLIDDRSIKSKFLFKNDEHTVALTIMDTDYETYLFAFALLGPKGVYYIGGKDPEAAESVAQRINDTLKENEIVKPFFDMTHKSCPTDNQAYLS